MIPGTPDFTAPGGVLTSPGTLLVKRIVEGYQGPDSPMAMPPSGSNRTHSREVILTILALRQKFGAHAK